MSDALLDSLVSALGDKQLESAGERVQRARDAAREAEEAAASVRAQRTRAQITPVPRELLDTTQSVPAAVQKCAQHAQGKLKGASTASLALEVAQHKAVASLAAQFASLTSEALGKKWYTHFEAWLFARRGDAASVAGGGRACMLPADTGPAAIAADHELQRKLLAAGVSQNITSDIVTELGRLPERLSHKIPTAVETEPHVKVSPFRGQKGVVPKLKLTCGGATVEINRSHYDKLRALHSLAATDSGAHDATAFTRAACAMLLRYSSLQGTHFRGGGFQAAVHGEVLEALRADFDCAFECFASPLNARYPRFCSMFPDTDRPFGSLGSFFAFRPAAGSFEANPPFDKALVKRMAAHMFQLLDTTKAALMFTVIIPTWQGHRCWELLRDSRHTTEHVDLDAGQHGFCEGAQHNRANRFRAASIGTSVFFLQTRAACSKWPVAAAKVARLREAFRPKSSSFTGAAEVNAAATLDVCAAGVVKAGRDALMQGDFSEGVAPSGRQSKARRGRGAAAAQDMRRDAIAQSDEGRPSGLQPGDDTTSEAGGSHSGAGEVAAGHAPTVAKKRKRCHVASSTGKFAPEGSAAAVVERLLAGAEPPGRPCSQHAGGTAQEKSGVAAGSPEAAEQGGTVAFPLSKSQRQKANRTQSARRKSAKQKRK